MFDIPESYSASIYKNYVYGKIIEKDDSEQKHLFAYNYRTKEFKPILKADITCWNILRSFLWIGPLAHITYDLEKVCEKLNTVDFSESSEHTKNQVYLLAIRLLGKSVRKGNEKPNDKVLEKTLVCARELLEKVSISHEPKAGDDSGIKLTANKTFYFRPGYTTTGDIKLQYVANLFFDRKPTEGEFNEDNNPFGTGTDYIGSICFYQNSIPGGKKYKDPRNFIVDTSKPIDRAARAMPQALYFEAISH